MIRKTAVMEIIKAHMEGEDKNTKAVLSDVMESVRETLEQEPCDECRNKRTSFCGNCNEYDEFEPCNDAVSRQAVKEQLNCWIGSGEYRYAMSECFLIDRINDLPPVTQKSGKCKNCKYFEYDSVAKVDGVSLIVAHEICNKWGGGCKTKEDGYCFMFEEKQDMRGAE